MRYAALTRYLEQQAIREVRLSFHQIEAIIGASLPPSARSHQPWWANTTTHTQAAAWLSAGWRTRLLSLAGEHVTFFKALPETVVAQRGVQEPPYAFEHDAVMVSMAAMSPAALRLIEDMREELGCGPGEAIAAAVNAFALDRRRRLLEQFPLTGERSKVDSVDLIREDRDGR